MFAVDGDWGLEAYVAVTGAVAVGLDAVTVDAALLPDATGWLVASITPLCGSASPTILDCASFAEAA